MKTINKYLPPFILYIVFFLIYFYSLKTNTQTVNWRSDLNNLSNIHKTYSILNNKNNTKQFMDLIKDGNYSTLFPENNGKVEVGVRKTIKYNTFTHNGYFLSPEGKGIINISGKCKDSNNKSINIDYRFYRITSPKSNDFVFYYKNIDNTTINKVLNNKDGNPLNMKFPFKLFSENQKILLGNNITEPITLNISAGKGIYGEDFISERLNSDFSTESYSGYSISSKNTTFNTSSLLHLSGDQINNFEPQIYGNVEKRLIAKQKADNKLLEKTSKYNNNIINDPKLETKNEKEHLFIEDIYKINENLFFTKRVTKNSKNIDNFIIKEKNKNILDIDDEIVLFETHDLYIPYIEDVKSGGVIICSGDIYIDTIKNTYDLPLTIISLNGKIIIGNNICASLIALSPQGEIAGFYKNRKEIHGNVIAYNINFDSFKKGADIYYNKKLNEPNYVLKIGEKPVSH